MTRCRQAAASAGSRCASATVPLALGLSHLCQSGITALAAAWLVVLRRGVVSALTGCGALGVIAALAHAPLP